MDKLRGKKNSDFLISILKDYLDPYFENINFDIQIHQFGTVFFVREVQIKKEVFKRMGIPLNIREGKLSEIKLTIGNLLTLTPIELEVTGFILEVNSIYLSKNYQSDIITIKEQLLYKWETIHKIIFNKKTEEENSYIENMIMNSISHLKIFIHSCKLIMVDNATISPDKKIIKKLELKIATITSTKIVEAKQIDINDKDKQKDKQTLDKITREILIEKFSVNIVKQSGDEYESTSTSDDLIQPINIQITTNEIFRSLMNKTQLRLAIAISDPLIINISKEKINFLANMNKYFSRTGKVEKYWIYRPDSIKMQTKSEAVEWLRYALKSVLTESRKKKRKDNSTYWLEDAINIERYTKYYATSRILQDQNARLKANSELKKIEERMPLENILHCREWIFQKLLENKDYANIKAIIQQYSPYNPMMWLSYSRFVKNKEDEISNKITKRKLILDLAYGNPSDIIISFTLNLNCFIININRKVKNEPMNNIHELPEQLRYYYLMYMDSAEKELNDVVKGERKNGMLHFFQWIEQLKEAPNYDYLTEAVMEEMKLMANSSIEGVAQLKEGLLHLSAKDIREDQCELTSNQNLLKLDNSTQDKPHSDTNPSIISQTNLLNDLKEQYSKKKIRKTLITIVFTNINTTFKEKLNDDILLDILILSFNIIDHNFSFIIANTDQSSLLNTIFEYKFNGGLIENYPFASEQEACDGVIINRFFDSINQSKIRNMIFSPSFLGEEHEFLNQFDYQFKFSKENLVNSTNNALLIDIFTNILVKFLYQKNLLTSLIEVIEQRLDNKNQIKCLLNSDESNFKSGFIMRIADKAINKFSIFSPTIKGNATHTKMTINYELMKENNEEEINPELFRKNFSSTINQFLQEDFQVIFKIIYLNIIKYIISPLLLYYTVDNNAWDAINSSYIVYAKIIKRKSFKKENEPFANISLLKKSKNLDEHESNKSKEQLNSNITITMNRSISLNISNETLAELIILIPQLIEDNSDSSLPLCSGNIYEDLTTTNMDVYDKFVDLKNEYFADYQEEQAMINHIELSYIENRVDLIKQIATDKFKISLTMNKCTIHIFDKVFFISTDLCSSINVELSNITITNEQLTSLPITELKQFTVNTMKNKITPELLMKLFIKTKLNVEKVIVRIDMKEIFLETNFCLSLLSVLWKNIYFVPNSITDIQSSKIVINLPPLILKVISLYTNMRYYVDLYKINYFIGSKSIISTQLKESKNEKRKINMNQVNIYTKHIEKLLYYDENVFLLKYYLIHRISSSLFYSVGNQLGETEGILINIKVEDNGSHATNVSKQSHKSKNCFSVQIPFFLFNFRESLFYQESQVWISSIKTNEAQNERFLQKLKVTYNPTTYNFTYVELLFCKTFIDSIGYLKHNPDVKTLDFTDTRLLFDKEKYQVPELNQVVSKTTFYYEETDLQHQYRKIFLNEQPINNELSSIKSNFSLNIEKISISFIGKNNQDLFLLIYNFRIYQNLCGHLLEGMLKINESEKTVPIINDKGSSNKDNSNNKVNNANTNVNTVNNNNNKSSSNNNIRNQTLITEANDEDLSTLNIPIKTKDEESIFKKHSMHTIYFFIKKITIKCLYDLSDTIKFLGLILYIKDIHYSENKNIGKDRREDVVLNNFSISSIKCLLSLPSFFLNKDDFANQLDSSKVPLYNSKEMLQLFDEVATQENKLLVLIIKGISINQNHSKVVFTINDEYKFGLLPRPKKRFHEKTIINIEDNILSIINNQVIQSKSMSNCYSELLKIVSDSTEELSQDHFITNQCIELTIEKPSNNNQILSSRPTLLSQQINQKEKQVNDAKVKIELFSHLKSMLAIIKKVLKANPKYKVTLSFGVIYIEIPSTLFSYVYYIRNYVRQGIEMISKAFKKKKRVTTMEIYPQSIIVEMINKQSSIQNRFATESSGVEAQKLSIKKKTKWLSRVAMTMNSKKKPEKVTLLISLDIPYIALVFKQLENKTMIPFSYFVFNEIEGNLFFAENNISESSIQVQIGNTKWKSNDVRCYEMIKKKGNNNVLKATIHPFKEINPNTPIINISLDSITLIFVFKCLKEIILFFEFNSKILDENPLKIKMDQMKRSKQKNQYIAEIDITNSSIIMPEDSQSANYICINIDKGNIQVKKTNELPKLLLAPKNPMIIDTKAIYDAKSIEPKDKEFLPHIDAFIDGHQLDSFFCINGQKDFLAQVEHLSMTFKQPFNDHQLTKLRKIEWEKRYKTHVITYKPSITMKLNGQMKCGLSNLLSLKQFIDNNFDEESIIKFLSEPNSMFNDIEMNFVFPTANFNMDLFKCYPDTATEEDATRIGAELPGNKKDIVYNEEQEYPLNKINEKVIETEKTQFDKKEIIPTEIEEEKENQDDNSIDSEFSISKRRKR